MRLLDTLLVFILGYLAISGLYQTIMALASYRKANKPAKVSDDQQKFWMLIPAYNCDEVIINTVKKNIRLKYLYPKSHFDLTVIADKLKEETKEKIQKLGAHVHEVEFKKSTKVKSLQSAIEVNIKDYNAVIILDADNIADFNFLNKANCYLNRGHQIIQGNRVAANKNSAFALLDGLSEAANTKMLCEGANRLGLSSKLSGSGMVFTYDLFAEAIMKMEAIGGFDKELELYFTQKGDFVHYTGDLIIKDEKIDNSEAFARQRGRWLQAQYNFFKKSIIPSLKYLAKGNIDYFHKTIQLALPPRALSPFVLVMFTLISVILGLKVAAIIGAIGLVLTMGSYMLVLDSKELFNNGIDLLKAMPVLFISVIKSLIIMKKAKKEFIHTKHKVVT